MLRPKAGRVQGGRYTNQTPAQITFYFPGTIRCVAGDMGPSHPKALYAHAFILCRIVCLLGKALRSIVFFIIAFYCITTRGVRFLFLFPLLDELEALAPLPPVCPDREGGHDLK